MDQSVNVNGTLRLSCNVSGSEPISYQWLKDGVLQQDDGRVSGSSDSMLMVEPVEGNDFGRYQCNVSNDVDQMLSKVAMVAGKGLAMTQCQVYYFLALLYNCCHLLFPLFSLPLSLHYPPHL